MDITVVKTKKLDNLSPMAKGKEKLNSEVN